MCNSKTLSDDSKVVYHYCSSETFLSIIQSKKVRFSMLKMSNDYLEGVVNSFFLDAIIKDSKCLKSLEELKSLFIAFRTKERLSHDALGFCLSKAQDSLCQWRAYADDAQGFCIGFYKDDLESKEEFDAIDVEYIDQDYVLNCFKTDEFVEIIKNNYKYKHKSFSEEMEYRLIIKDPDELNYRAINNAIIPYYDVDMAYIAEVWIGSKNNTPDHIVKRFLCENGFNNVIVKKSVLSYR